jgi:hypothetical protein
MLKHFWIMHIEFWQCYAEENVGASAVIQKRDRRTGWTGKPVRAVTTLYLIILISHLKFCFFQSFIPLKFFDTVRPVFERSVFDRSGWTSIVFWFSMIEHLFILNSLCLIFKENPWLQRSWQISVKVTPLFFEKKWLPGRRRRTHSIKQIILMFLN